LEGQSLGLPGWRLGSSAVLLAAAEESLRTVLMAVKERIHRDYWLIYRCWTRISYWESWISPWVVPRIWKFVAPAACLPRGRGITTVATKRKST
jgi:hypothetical protein